ncbi:MAG: ankyrin repeat domain-containing protein, partial [Spirochaetes bacterium]|nr:ankyrin repeat domain-containing protein [Spirochaetota bacterium]
VKQGHVEVVQLLLNYGADVNAQNREGQTALLMAEAAGYTEIEQLLKEAVVVDVSK